jgi:hypothetical protein
MQFSPGITAYAEVISVDPVRGGDGFQKRPRFGAAYQTSVVVPAFRRRAASDRVVTC